MLKVLVFGSSGYLGLNLIKQLSQSGDVKILAATHNAGSTAKLKSLKVPIEIFKITSNTATIRSHLTGTNVIINLAYGNRGDALNDYQTTIDITNQTLNLAKILKPQNYIHISTQAVFGYSPHSPPPPIRHNSWIGDSYIISKARSENIIEKSGLEKDGVVISIVRLGNIIGPGSMTWTLRLIDRLSHNIPIGYKGKIGYSNATFVTNTSSYLSHLLHQDPKTLKAFGKYHHLAEFSNVPWSQWILYLCNLFGCNPVYLYGSPLKKRNNYLKDLINSFKAAAPVISKKLILSQFWGPLLIKSGNALKLKRFLNNFKKRIKGINANSNEDVTLDILSTEVEFRSHVLQNWKPPVDFATANNLIGDWIKLSGFLSTKLSQ